MKTGMFKKFFKFISMPFKSDVDIADYSKINPTAGKAAKIIKGCFTVINAYIDLWSLNELLKLFGRGIKHFPDIVQIVGKFTGKAAKVAAVAI